MQRDAKCIFCRIVAAELPSHVVYEDETILSFLDIGPLSEGHLLVIPREHFSRFTDVPASTSATLATMLPTLGRALLSVTKADGFNLLMNEGNVAGQVVPHVHFHLIPRNAGDNLGYRWNPGKYPPGRDSQLASSLQAALAAHGQ
ncbi:MAG: HIT family protein [Planctomycetes bacterium]|nr:HIT family protein [Planctomycetota bacterium]MBI3836033.1 HIT family protein [Planctomycetota bacterium]